MENTTKDKIDRVDSYLKTIFQALVGWFTFFITINWATLGWLGAKFTASCNDSKDGGVSETIAKVFAWQNILGIVLCILVLSIGS